MNIHIILQGKGGVGKSVIAAMIAQYKESKGQTPICVDTDPVNATFAGYRSLNVKRIQIMEDEEIKPRNFDLLIELIANAQDDVVIDNGASSFVALSHYLITQQVPALVKSMGHELLVHTVITGGQAQLDTINGFQQLARQFPIDALFCVWLNPFWGKIEHDGKGFEEMRAYQDHQARVSGLVRIPTLREDTFGQDFGDMLQARLTFAEAIAMPDKPIMVRQRLKMVQKELFESMASTKVL
ncbi:conjugal transfer protein TraL [uncultured Thiodictyon sp.]|uniref:nucleotide-binding protein n=1 Tax=uncultured Thiodictyon sp. TaxID=1846217 RepID=UPI0025FE5C23|nr:conjugal transfer protein TraL [uncultured Thiodictyon sp.]